MLLLEYRSSVAGRAGRRAEEFAGLGTAFRPRTCPAAQSGSQPLKRWLAGQRRPENHAQHLWSHPSSSSVSKSPPAGLVEVEQSRGGRARQLGTEVELQVARRPARPREPCAASLVLEAIKLDTRRPVRLSCSASVSFRDFLSRDDNRKAWLARLCRSQVHVTRTV